MAIVVRFDASELERFTEDLDLFATQQVSRILRAGAEAAGRAAVKTARQTYPPPQRTRGQRRGATGRFISGKSPLRTQRQIRWWWATMRGKAEGSIPSTVLPGWTAAYATVDGRKRLVISGSYKRSGQLERSLKFSVEMTEGETGPSAVTDVYADPELAPYAKYVIGQPPPEGDQALYHQGHWIPLVTLLDRNSQEILDAAEQPILEQVSMALISVKAYT